jgi:hypothetical protein
LRVIEYDLRPQCFKDLLVTIILPLRSAFSSFESLIKWKRQRDSSKEHPLGLYGRVVEVGVEKLELLVKQIRRSNGDETIPLRQTVIDRRIDGPEVSATGLNNAGRNSLKPAVLIPVRCRQEGAQSGRVEKIDP